MLVACLNAIAQGGGSNLFLPEVFATFMEVDIRERIKGSKIVREPLPQNFDLEIWGVLIRRFWRSLRNERVYNQFNQSGIVGMDK
jgi:hypothetical protein